MARCRGEVQGGRRRGHELQGTIGSRERASLAMPGRQAPGNIARRREEDGTGEEVQVEGELGEYGGHGGVDWRKEARGRLPRWRGALLASLERRRRGDQVCRGDAGDGQAGDWDCWGRGRASTGREERTLAAAGGWPEGEESQGETVPRGGEREA